MIGEQLLSTEMLGDEVQKVVNLRLATVGDVTGNFDSEQRNCEKPP